MENKVSLFLGIISCTLLVLCGATREEYIALEKAVNSLSNIVGTYNAEFDKKVKFEVLQEAIEAIDKAMFGYHGEAKKNLDEIRELNSDAHLTYKKCVGPVYEWCISMNSKCYEYVVWHGYGTKNYLHKRVRTKRDTTESFEMGRISRIIQSLPENYDFDMIVSATSKIMN